MADYEDNVTRLGLGSDVVRVHPNKLVQIFSSGTSTLVAEAISDSVGKFSISTLATGKYDLKVDGKLVKTIQHVTAAHTHKMDEVWNFFFSGAISADQNEVNTQRVYGVTAAADVLEIIVTAEKLTSTGDVTVHLLRSGKSGASQLTFGSNSIWSKRIYIGGSSTVYRYLTNDLSSGITLGVDDTVTAAVDYVAAGVEGVNVVVKVRPR